MNAPAELRDNIVDALAAYRLTRLVTADVITRPLRVRIIRHAYRARFDGGVAGFDDWNAKAGLTAPTTESEWDLLPEDDADAPKLATLVTCRWCAGFYISVWVVLARRYAGRLWDPLARALALSATAALVAGLEDD